MADNPVIVALFDTFSDPELSHATPFGIETSDTKVIASIADLIKSDRTKIIEVWQGHLDKYAGFQQALESLEERFNDE